MSDALKIVTTAIEEVNAGLERNTKIGSDPTFVLMGEASVIDSLTLVRLLVSVETIAEEILGKDITLMDDSAFESEGSPLSTVGSLTHHIDKLIARD